MESRPSRWRLTAERFSVDSDENLGLVGAHFDLLQAMPALPELYLGLGGYGALTGRRGGLFVGGVTAGYLRELYPGWNLDAGLFVGGGGGGGGGENDGLMLRPHIAVERSFEGFALRLEAAKLELGDGVLDDTHFAVGVTLPSELLLARRRRTSRSIPAESLRRRRVRVRPSFLQLAPDAGSRNNSGLPLTDRMDLMGVGVDYFLGRRLYLTLEAHGAGGGGVDGFAMAMGGAGIRLPLIGSHLGLEAQVLGGSSGGGGVDTGGGYGWQAVAGLRAALGHALSVFAGAGTTRFPDGDFEADTLSIGLSWATETTELAGGYPRSELARSGLTPAQAHLVNSRVYLLNKTYLPDSGIQRKNGGSHAASLQLLGVGVDQPLTRHWTATGRAFGAYGGDIGGYGEGLFGLRYETPILGLDQHHASVMGEIGVAGGGGADVGSGLVVSGTAGYRWDFHRDVSAVVEVGLLRSPGGPFDPVQVTVGLAWNLPRALLR